MTKAWGAGIRLAGGVVLVLASGSCGDLTREGQSPAYLIVSELTGASGSDPEKFSAVLFSDVLTGGGVINDLGRVTLVLALKDPGPSTSPTRPTANNFITITRYRVRYTRADGRNREGVDVPYGFDGGITFTVQGETTATFELVRNNAKRESPLAALSQNLAKIASIAEISFFGHDATGRDVIATGTLTIEFGNFADPD